MLGVGKSVEKQGRSLTSEGLQTIWGVVAGTGNYSIFILLTVMMGRGKYRVLWDHKGETWHTEGWQYMCVTRNMDKRVHIVLWLHKHFKQAVKRAFVIRPGKPVLGATLECAVAQRTTLEFGGHCLLIGRGQPWVHVLWKHSVAS
jgi:hypothetical protein